MSLEENIKKWVEYDSLIKNYNEKIKSFREKRQEVESSIHRTVDSYEKKPVINISDGTLKFTKTNIQQPLSYKLIENGLQRIIKSEDQINRIINTIRETRNIKEINTIKRYYR